MKQYRFLDKPIHKLLFAAAIYLLICISRETVYSLVIFGVNKTTALSYGVVFLMGLWFLWVNKGRWKEIFTDARLWMLLPSAVLCLVPMLAKQDWQLMYITIFICLCVSVFLSFCLSLRDMAKYYVVILCIMAFFSLLADYVIKPIVGNSGLPVTVWQGPGHPYYNFWIATPKTWLHYYRNFGYFREPGVYQFFLVLAMYLNNYHVTWTKKAYSRAANGILAVTVLSTFSSGGLVELVLLLVILFFDRGLHKNPKVRCLALFALIAGAMVAAAILVSHERLRNAAFVMVEKLFVLNLSSAARYDSIYYDIILFARNPLFGEKLKAVLEVVVSNTSSTMVLFSAFGAAAGILHVASWVALVWNREKPILINLGLLVVLLMSFNIQNLTVNQFFWLFPWMALTERGVPWLQQLFKKKES